MIALPSALRAIGIAAAMALAGCNSMSTAPTSTPTAMATPPATATTAAATTTAANTMGFTATMSTAAEVPPKTSAGAGTLTADLNKTTNVLTWKMSYSGLTGPATMAHFHGPALPGVNAGVVVPFTSAASPSEGSATLTPTQVADLVAGKWYVNVHTQVNPGGEIRGQLLAK